MKRQPRRFPKPATRLALTLAIAMGAPLGARADQDCAVPIELWQDKGAVLAEVKDKWGLAPKRLRIDDGCYAVTAYDTEGNELKILFDPQTLVPVELKIEFSGRGDPAHYLGRIRPSTPCGSDCGEGDN